VRALIVVALLAAPAPATADCRDSERPAELLRAGHAVDAHLLAEVLLVLCPAAPDAPRWRVVDALALHRLDEPERARARLTEVGGPRAAVLLAWSHLATGDRAAYAQAARALAPEAAARLATLAAAGDREAFRARAARLDAALRAAAERAHEDVRRARRRSPVAAALLSAVLPGAGQAYAGSWPAAGIALALNAVLIGATVELADRRLYLGAATTGLAASVFYAGNILNAADLAARRNQIAARPAYQALEELLVPEVRP
jgi:hypothetical protein